MHDREHRVAAGRRVVSEQHHRLPVGGHLDGTQHHPFAGQLLVADPLDRLALEPEPHPVRRSAHGVRRRADWFGGDALERLCSTSYVVGEASNRIGLRLDGPAPERVRDDELPSEGMVLGAVQVPPGGQPVVFLADHPPTGGYPVLAVVHPDDLWQCAQLRPGEELRFVRGA